MINIDKEFSNVFNFDKDMVNYFQLKLKQKNSDTMFYIIFVHEMSVN